MRSNPSSTNNGFCKCTKRPHLEYHKKNLKPTLACFSREGRGSLTQPNEHQRIGDVVLRNFDAVTTDYYLKYVDSHSLILEKLEDALLKDSRFAQIYREFEEQKVCYLPITTLLLKPMHRILHYELLLDSKLRNLDLV